MALDVTTNFRCALSFGLALACGCAEPSHDAPGTASAPTPAPPGAVTPRDPGAPALELYEIDLPPESLFAGHTKPDGVHVVPSYVNAEVGALVQAHRVGFETLAETVQRVRPWLDTLPLPPNRTWLLPRMPTVASKDQPDILLVHATPIGFLGSDVAWIAVRKEKPDDDGLVTDRVEVQLTAAGRDQLAKAIAGMTEQQFAIAVGGRRVATVWADRDAVRDSIVIEGLDPAPLATAVRDAIAGDPAAIEAIANDRIANGGTVADLREAQRLEREAWRLPLPPPTVGADGRTHASLQIDEKSSLSASLIVPRDFVLEEHSTEFALWKRRDEGAGHWTMTLTTECHGFCSSRAIDEQMDEACAKAFARTKPEKPVEKIVDVRTAAHRRCGTARASKTVKGELAESTDLHCYVTAHGGDRVFELEVRTSGASRTAAIADFEAACESLRPERG